MIQLYKGKNEKSNIRSRRRTKIRATVVGSTERPRLSVFKSNRHFFVQIIDDSKGFTLAAVSSKDEELGKLGTRNVEVAKKVGHLIAKRSLAKGIKSVVFDRGGYKYHGRIAAIADAAREAGLQF
jgi:large subunit ribosomal protein L18